MPNEAVQANNDVAAVMKTTKGDIRLTLFPAEAPLTVANFVNLAQRTYYDGLKFHRVLANFMIQGGDPTGTGRGGPGYNFADEFSRSLRHDSAGHTVDGERGSEYEWEPVLYHARADASPG